LLRTLREDDMAKPKAGSDKAPDDAQRFRHLPKRVPLGELVAEQSASEPPDPDALTEPTGDWMHRPF
jgi:hypothetical protein